MKKVLALFAAVVVALLVWAVPVAADGSNLIVNGDFEEGNTGFTTDYTYVDPGNTGSWTLGPPYTYTVSTDPHLYHSAWASFGDHTTGTGNMTIVNGSSNGYPPEVVWAQNVTLEPASAFPLFAGQTWEIGQVLVKTSESGICVKFVLTDEAAIADGWVITEVHVAVGATLANIPQTKPNKKGLGGGNPIPGLFPVNVDIDPGVTETDWFCLGYNWTKGESPVIAAHAVVSQIQPGYTVSGCLVSGNGTDNVLLLAENATNPGYPGGYPGPYTGNWTPSVLAWTHTAWAPFGIEGAQWISSADLAEDPDHNTWRLFTRSFDLPSAATNISGTMWANCDNAEEVYLNGQSVGVGSPAVVYGGTPDPGPAHGWSSVEGPWDVTSQLVAGTNALWIMTRNYGWEGGPYVNPTALIYKLCYEYDMPPVVLATETAWGGENAFPGANWATYIEYTPQSYLLKFYAASSYPEAPAQLQVTINGAIVGPNLNCTSTPGQWVEYSATWNAGSATEANIEIRDLCDTYTGDDFVIDDISFVRQ